MSDESILYFPKVSVGFKLSSHRYSFAVQSANRERKLALSRPSAGFDMNFYLIKYAFVFFKKAWSTNICLYPGHTDLDFGLPHFLTDFLEGCTAQVLLAKPPGAPKWQTTVLSWIWDKRTCSFSMFKLVLDNQLKLPVNSRCQLPRSDYTLLGERHFVIHSTFQAVHRILFPEYD